MTQRTRRGFDSRQSIVRVTTQASSQLAALFDVFVRQNAEFFQGYELSHRAVALGQNKCIATGPSRCATHQAEVNCVDQFHAGKSRCYMEGAEFLRYIQYPFAHSLAALPGGNSIENGGSVLCCGHGTIFRKTRV